ncbi:unnamed protein product [Acanthoscelides obtectus]|uniref:Zinc finger PHD-type domain-containing protein n=1 Tax=Acanthoscelides obtectus TaxID=200917 RepID=A0A9P0PJ51_ACAOB|nr:unnamed protein product [Acanthoscelides obtectus]CAK1645811.1 Tigger transposable element-derived protein 1 [Acanthoscelides obtectus]
MALSPDITSEQSLVQRVAELQVKIQYLDSMYRSRQEDLQQLVQRVELATPAGPASASENASSSTLTAPAMVGGIELKPEVRALLKNMSGMHAAHGVNPPYMLRYTKMSSHGNDGQTTQKKGTWDPANMHKAVEKVLNHKISARQAAERYQVPRSTLNDRVKAIKSNKEMSIEPVMGRFHNTFAPEHEEILASHVKDLANRLMPLNRQEFLRLAFQLAEKLKLPHQFNKEKQSAGKNYYYSFMKRHSDLSLRTAESTSLMRAVGFNRPQVMRFFDGLETLMERFKFTPYKIWNCDETGVSIVQKHAKGLATKNQRQVGKLTSAERGKNVTVLFAMSAGGQFVPPYFIFPRNRMNERLMINAPNESVGEAQPNGWMNAELFLKWMQHFVQYSNPTAQNPVLLILDGHASHKDLDVIEFARKNNIHMLSTPPHTTHKLQPLDRTFMKPFKSAYNDACDLWMRANPAIRISEYEIAGFVAIAFNRVSRMDIAVNGFHCTGIHPFDRNIFSDLDFIGSDMTNVTESQSATESSLSHSQLTEPTPSTSACSNLSNSISTQQELTSISSRQLGSQTPTSNLLADITTSIQSETQTTPTHAESEILSIQQVETQTEVIADKSRENFKAALTELSPVPDASKRRTTVRRRKAERSEIITSSPYKRMLEEKRADKRNVEQLKKKVNVSEKDVIKKGKSLLSGRDVSKKTKTNKNENLPPPRRSIEETVCPLCAESHEEDWIQCGNCKIWVHEACANVSELSDQYICDYCIV